LTTKKRGIFTKKNFMTNQDGKAIQILQWMTLISKTEGQFSIEQETKK